MYDVYRRKSRFCAAYRLMVGSSATQHRKGDFVVSMLYGLSEMLKIRVAYRLRPAMPAAASVIPPRRSMSQPFSHDCSPKSGRMSTKTGIMMENGLEMNDD
jgi:hypothetical protein